MRKILSWPFVALGFVFAFGIAMPIHWIRTLLNLVDRGIALAVYHAVFVPKRWLRRESLWKPADLKLGILAPAPDGSKALPQGVLPVPAHSVGAHHGLYCDGEGCSRMIYVGCDHKSAGNETCSDCGQEHPLPPDCLLKLARDHQWSIDIERDTAMCPQCSDVATKAA